MQKFRYVLYVVIALFIALYSVLWIVGTSPVDFLASLKGDKSASKEGSFVEFAQLGGDFNLDRADRTPFTQDNLLGKHNIIFFGFTNCPAICPTTLYQMGLWIDQMGEDAKDYQFVFISVDPLRDTHERISEYMGNFSDKIIALTGTEAQVQIVIDMYHVYVRKVTMDMPMTTSAEGTQMDSSTTNSHAHHVTEDNYMVDHTSSLYLLDKHGKFHGFISNDENPAKALQKILKMKDIM